MDVERELARNRIVVAAPGEVAPESGEVKLGAWDAQVEQWIVRVTRLAEWFPELEVAPITEDDRLLLVEQICFGSFGARDLKDKPVMPVLRDW